MKIKTLGLTLLFLIFLTSSLLGKDIRIKVSCRIPATYEVNLPENVNQQLASLNAKTSLPEETTVQLQSTNTPLIQMVEKQEKSDSNEKTVIVYTIVAP